MIKEILKWKWLFVVSISTFLVFFFMYLYASFFISGWDSGVNLGKGLLEGLLIILFIGIAINYIMYLSLRNHEKLSEIYKVLAWLLQIPATLYLLFAIFMTLFDNVKTMM